MNLLDEVKKNPFLLAPMAGITDKPFRSFMRQLSCGAVTTELVSATGLKFNSKKTRRLMAFSQDQHPVGIQVFGDDLEDLCFAVREAEGMGVDFVDLNFGCPVPKVVKKGAGSALLKDLVRAAKVFRAVRSATSLPVTVKIRTGWDSQSIIGVELAKIAYEEGLTWVAIHGRTRAQGYSGTADWDYIAEVKSKSKIAIIGNGDISSAKMAYQRLQDSGCDGVMIGRGCLKNPWIFLEALSLYQGQINFKVKKDFLTLIDNLSELLAADSEERIVLIQLKKFSSWYSSGYPGSAQFRKGVFQIQDLSSLKQYITDYFAKLEYIDPEDTSTQPFLMGGHG